ncbi:EVE domain-containing protein [Polymorphobacter fuscus]|uniref:EVE domain-containing protein n=1 Tax=Sandarakinorhabdus fusca TaxID=1439888 RepID=A0A7C9KX68_9SPHN|nr:EVE domain-containing protein [Polymorphobacter fuscus]KAB7646375.1 EVE domain-containing protein [Polymorphobacter fuscus]MQT17605.1 EVE domain-containing protein [Polymorphobacter fuscus]NJC09852.1 putative RNA-binding protein with PUA-like domain [Polymorphobacter fuscus]
MHWLVKSEPFKYSWDMLVRDGSTTWDGVRNNQAAIYLRTMALGEELFFYHSNEGLAVVGVARVSGEHFIDPTDPKGRFPAVTIAPVRALARPVTLAAMKAEPRLAEMAMFRQFRLSVAPVTDAEWEVILAMGGG